MKQNQFITDNLLKEAFNREHSKMFNEAISIYESAIEKNEKNYCAYFSLGTLYEKMNNSDKAKEIYLKGIGTARSFNDKEAEMDLSFTLLGLIDLSFE